MICTDKLIELDIKERSKVITMESDTTLELKVFIGKERTIDILLSYKPEIIYTFKLTIYL